MSGAILASEEPSYKADFDFGPDVEMPAGAALRFALSRVKLIPLSVEEDDERKSGQLGQAGVYGQDVGGDQSGSRVDSEREMELEVEAGMDVDFSDGDLEADGGPFPRRANQHKLINRRTAPDAEKHGPSLL